MNYLSELLKAVFSQFQLISTIACCLLPFASCKRGAELPEVYSEFDSISYSLNIPQTPFNYSTPPLPSFFNNQFIHIQNNTPADNPVTDWGATLGRVLFYDKYISLNHTISCASCHVQAFGFSDTAKFSKGITGSFTKRHSMALVNAMFYSNGRFFWDERAKTLEAQVLEPIQDSIEMGLNVDILQQRIQSKSYYPTLFKYAFGDEAINTDRIAKPLAQFIRSLISYRSKYDQGMSIAQNNKIDFPNFTPEENLGKSIFFSHPVIPCSGCHTTDVFITDNPRNNGIQLDNVDQGTFLHTQNPIDLGKFKSPSLKNVALRNTYMHNGSLRGLDEVIEHYNSSMLPNPNLDVELKNISNNSPNQMNLTLTERKALKAFLETLTDYELIQDEKFSSPFK